MELSYCHFTVTIGVSRVSRAGVRVRTGMTYLIGQAEYVQPFMLTTGSIRFTLL